MDKILCVGKNYMEHAKELGDQVPNRPILFIKPASCLFRLGEYQTLEIPKNLGEIHHELELVFKIKKENEGFSICGWTIGLDLTARDLQRQLKDSGHPWERAKAFPKSAVTGEFHGLTENYLETPFELHINNELRQKGHGKEMRWKPEELLQEVSQTFTLCDGDLLFTGTPQGVGPLKPGDRLQMTLGSLVQHEVKII